MPKQDDKHSMAEDYLAQLGWLINSYYRFILPLEINNGQIMRYWKEVPYRGQPEKKPPKPPKRVRSQKEIRRRHLNVVVAYSIVAILILVAFFFLPPDNRTSFAKILIFGSIILLLMVGVDKGIKAWNKYLRADDLDEPKDVNEKQEE